MRTWLLTALWVSVVLMLIGGSPIDTPTTQQVFLSALAVDREIISLRVVGPENNTTARLESVLRASLKQKGFKIATPEAESQAGFVLFVAVTHYPASGHVTVEGSFPVLRLFGVRRETIQAPSEYRGNLTFMNSVWCSEIIRPSRLNDGRDIVVDWESVAIDYSKPDQFGEYSDLLAENVKVRASDVRSSYNLRKEARKQWLSDILPEIDNLLSLTKTQSAAEREITIAFCESLIDTVECLNRFHRSVEQMSRNTMDLPRESKDAIRQSASRLKVKFVTDVRLTFKKLTGDF